MSSIDFIRRCLEFAGMLLFLAALIMSVGVANAEVSEAQRTVGADSVPEPFLPVRVILNGAGPGSKLISVWGREYRFGHGPLPAEIVSQGADLFASPPQFYLDTGSGRRTIEWSSPEIIEQGPRSINLASHGRMGVLELKANTTIEYDGMIRVQISMTARQSVRISSYSYSIRLNENVGEYYNHHVAYDYQKLAVDRNKLIDAAGSVPDTKRRFSFFPTFFVGNKEVGMEWWCESDSEWAGPWRYRAIELGREGSYVEFAVEPIAVSRVLDANESWSDTFAIFPTPLRAPPRNWRSIRFASLDTIRQKSNETHNKFAYIAFPNQFDAQWHGLPASRKTQKQSDLRNTLREAGALYLPYGTLTAVPFLHPVVMKNSDDWSASSRLWTGPPKSVEDFLKQGGWRQGDPFGYAACMERDDYIDWMLGEYETIFREEELDGLYFDHAAMNEMCVKSERLKNRQGRQVWSYFSLRHFYMKLYESIKAQRPDALLTMHTNGQPRAFAAWADFTFIGEGWNVLFRGGHGFREIANDRSLYKPDYFRLPRVYLDAALLPRLGGITAVLPEIHHGIDPEHPEIAQKYQRAFFAQILPYDVPVWHANSETRMLSSVFDAIDSFGPVDDAAVYQWWKHQGAVPSDRRIVATTYALEGRALIIVANWSEKDMSADLVLDRDLLQLRPGYAVRDGESKSRTLKRGDADDTFPLTVPAHDLRILIAG